LGETVSSCEFPAEPEGATQLNCCSPEFHIGVISGLVHCPKELIERIDSIDSVDSTAYVRTFIEAPYRSAEAARKIALSSCRSRDLFIGCEFLVTWNVAGRPTSAPNLERMEDIFCGGSPAPASS
jgi:hypothetical protein